MLKLIIKLRMLLAFVFAVPLVSAGQVLIEPLGAGFRSYEEITRFNINNGLTEPVSVSIRIDLTEKTNGNVLTITVHDATLRPGINSFREFSSIAKLSFYSTSSSNHLKTNDRLADGDYRVCYTIISKKGQFADASYCLNFTIGNSTPLILVAPFNGQDICEERPTFQWQNPMPLPADAKTRMVLVALQEGQNETEAIYRNVPVLNVMDVNGSNLPLPSFVEQLKENSTYAWQVIIYNASGILAKSEIWTFKKSCRNAITQPPTLAFGQLKSFSDGNYYIAKDFINFSFNNSYSTEKLDYTIVDAETNTPIRYYPEVSIRTGMNYISIDVDDCRGLKKGKYYVLIAKNVHSSALQMRFRYDGN
jgi:hypothetical protein